MKIYTSYFSNLKNLDEDTYTFISISASRPKWVTGVTIYDLPVLHPHWDLINDWKSGTISWGEYTDRYYAQLQSINPTDILHKIEELSNGRDVILLCWEGSDKPCHRHLIGPLLGLVVKEI